MHAKRLSVPGMRPTRCPLDFTAVTFAAAAGKGGEGGCTAGNSEAGAFQQPLSLIGGTFVLDASHKATRGYGKVESHWPEVDDDGDYRCRVRFEGPGLGLLGLKTTQTRMPSDQMVAQTLTPASSVDWGLRGDSVCMAVVP